MLTTLFGLVDLRGVIWAAKHAKDLALFFAKQRIPQFLSLYD